MCLKVNIIYVFTGQSRVSDKLHVNVHSLADYHPETHICINVFTMTKEFFRDPLKNYTNLKLFMFTASDYIVETSILLPNIPLLPHFIDFKQF